MSCGLKSHNSNILVGKSLDVIQDNKIRVRCLLLAKRNGQDYRLVTDLRGVNSKTLIMANPLPTTQEALENIGMHKPKWFSTMDLQSGFFQAELHPDSK